MVVGNGPPRVKMVEVDQQRKMGQQSLVEQEIASDPNANGDIHQPGLSEGGEAG